VAFTEDKDEVGRWKSGSAKGSQRSQQQKAECNQDMVNGGILQQRMLQEKPVARLVALRAVICLADWPRTDVISETGRSSACFMK
jgi:hypothetical protein